MSRLKKVAALFVYAFAVTLMISMISLTDVEAARRNIYLNYSSITMTEGYSMKLKVKGTSKKVKWKSTNKKVATVSKKGRVKGKKTGKCTITAKVKGKKYKCRVVIKKVKLSKCDAKKLTGPALNVSELKLDVSANNNAKNGKASYKLELLNVSSSKKVTWTTSDDKIASVKGGNVVALSKGQCTVTATYQGKEYKCNVYITDLKDDDKISKQSSIYEMLRLINKDRAKVKAVPLKIKEEVAKVADIRAAEISKVFEHTRPDGTSFSTAYATAGFKKGCMVGENIGYISAGIEYRDTFVKNIYKSFYDSKNHRENMLNPIYEYVGISCFSNIFNDENGDRCITSYWAQEFYTK